MDDHSESTDPRYPDIMKAICELSEESADNIRSMPLERINAELAADGIEVAPHIKSLKTKLAKLRAAQELERARQRHEELTKKTQARTPVDRIADVGQRMLDLFAGGQPTLKGAFFRKLTDANDETRQKFAEDMELVNELEAEEPVEPSDEGSEPHRG